MSGILDNKSRIMDTIVTFEGRRQMAEGKLKIEFVSFTDSAAFYDADIISGSADPTNRLYFEQCQLPQDQITLEADDSGKIRPIKSVTNVSSSGGQIYQSNEPFQYTFLDGAAFASAAETLLASSIENFKNLQVLTTKDYIFETEGFDIGPSNVEFSIDNELPIKISGQNRNLSGLPSIFNDKDFSHAQNFKYLPPINKIANVSTNRAAADVIEANKIGNYPNLREPGSENYDYNMLKADLSVVEADGFMKTITFDPTSLSNRIVTQAFAIESSEMKKLDVVEYGTYVDDGKIKQIFFLGKVLTDANDCQTFIKMFTLVFE